MKSLTPNLMVEDVNATAAFYEQLFDFQLVTSVPDMSAPDSGRWQFAMLQHSGIVIMFQNRATLVADIPELDHAKTGGTFTLYFNVKDVRGLFKKVKSRVRIIGDGLTETFYGTLEFTCADSNGYILTFAQEENWQMEEHFYGEQASEY